MEGKGSITIDGQKVPVFFGMYATERIMKSGLVDFSEILGIVNLIYAGVENAALINDAEPVSKGLVHGWVDEQITSGKPDQVAGLIEIFNNSRAVQLVKEAAEAVKKKKPAPKKK